jgi:glycosyltransferase involved in cell wall biosynthesis
MKTSCFSGGRPPRVLLAIDGLGPGGAERQLYLLSRGLLLRGVRVSVWSFHGGETAKEITALGIPTAAGGSRPGAAARAVSQVASFRPDIIHSWGWISAFIMEALARCAGCAHVTGLVRMGTLPARKRRRLLLASRLGKLSIGNSRAGLAAWRIPPSRGRMVPNGFDPERLGPSEAPKRNFEGFTAVMAGSMAGHKDFESLVRTAALLARKAPGRFTFRLVGDGPDRPFLERLALDGGCGGSVEFTGRVCDVIPFLRDASAGVLLSPAGEGMSNFLMECMASGLPVVCTRSGGNPELVRDGVDGCLLERSDPESLAGLLLRLADGPELCRIMGASGRERILSIFTVDRMLHDTLEVYAEAMGTKGALEP